MRIISSEAQAALDSGRFRRRCLLRADLDDGPFAVWDDIGAISYEGVTYHGAAGKFVTSRPMSVSDLSARNMDVTFAGIDIEVANVMDTGAWHERPVWIARAIISEDTPQIIHVMPVFSGYIDQMLRRDLDTSTLVFRCESPARELSRRGVRTRGDADQRQRDPDDAFFAFTAKSGQEPLDWGRQPVSRVAADPPKKKFFGLF